MLWKPFVVGFRAGTSLEKVQALLETFLFPGSLFSCNFESYVRKLDKIRVPDKNSTKSNLQLAIALRDHFGVFSASSPNGMGKLPLL